MADTVIIKPRTRLGTFPLGKLVNDIRDTLKDYISEGIPIPLLETFYNDAVLLWFMAKLTGSVEYKDEFVLPVVFSVLSNEQDGSGYDADTRILVLPEGDQENITWTNCTGFSNNWLGAVITLIDTDSETTYQATITEYIETVNGYTRVLLDTTAPTIAAADLVVSGNTEANMETDILELTQYSSYKTIYDIDRLMSSTAGRCIGPPQIDADEFEGIKSTHKQTWSNYGRQVIWIRRGEKVECSLGGKLTSYGTRTFHVTLFPLVMSEEDDLMDVLDIYKPSIDRIVRIRAISSMPRNLIKISPSGEDLSWYKELEAAAIAKKNEEKK
jgi:hypothetical protein